MTDASASPDGPGDSARSGRRFSQQILAVMGLGLAVLALMAGAAWWLGNRLADHTAWVEHTYAAETKIAGLQSLLERTETARRGFLLTGSPISWKDYETSSAAWPEAVRDLESFISDNPRQLRRIAILRPLVERVLSTMTRNMVLAQTGARDQATAEFRASDEIATIHNARGVLDRMIEEERQLLQARAAVQATATTRFVAAIISSAALLAVLSLGAVWVIRRFAADLFATQKALETLNANLERQVAVRTADLVRANEEIQRFAYIVSHDLRSPLVNVMGFTSELEIAFQALKKLADAAEARAPDLVGRDARDAVERDLPEAIGFIRSSTQKMDRLINAILKLSREGRRNLTPEPVEMTSLARATADNLKTQADRRGAAITIEGDLPPVVTDRLAVEQVLSNLMENAVKYAAPDRPGRVVVRGRRVDGELVYEVEDNGRGIDPRDHERVFELFRRAGAQDQPGEGIGLAAVRALVHRLGGRITVSSELDRGATFRLCLPPTLSSSREAAA